MATTTMTEAEASVMEFFVENRFEDIDQCRLNDSVANRRYTQGSLLIAAWFGYLDSAHRLRTICPRLELLFELLDFSHSIGIEVISALPIHSSCPFLADHFAGRHIQVQLTAHLVNQGMPFTTSHSYRECVQHAVGPNISIHPGRNLNC